tara:strand:+ start:42905 stop:43069 length:165 start_codon:yes stop_codon:yes gene_type:complete
MASGEYGELIFDKVASDINDVKDFREVPFLNNKVMAGRLNTETVNGYCLLLTTG